MISPEEKAQFLELGYLHVPGAVAGKHLTRFNAAVLHGATLAATPNERRILQVYYGRDARPSLSQVPLMPPRLWRDDPDPEARRFYGKLNRVTQDMRHWLGAE